VQLIRPLPRHVTRPLSVLVLLAWVASLSLLVHRSYLQASANLATDLARYGSEAKWRGVYYRGDKIGFTVSQAVPTGEGYELQEDARLQMTLLGATTPAIVHTSARVDHGFVLKSFDFSLDPGTGPIQVGGRLDGLRLTLTITSGGATRVESRELAEPPAMMVSLARRLAGAGLTPGARYRWTMFDPATMTNAPVAIEVGDREIVRADDRPIPAFRVALTFAGLTTTSWLTDTGEVVREESPLGLLSVAETADRARALTVPESVQADLLEASAVVPVSTRRIDEPRDVRRLTLRLAGADLTGADLQGVGQSVNGDVVELTDPRELTAGPAPANLADYLKPAPFIESDAPEIRDEAARALEDVTGGARARAERLTRHVNGLLEKRPTVSLPSALDVLRTKVGDCNEHTALFVALARAAGIPSRIAVGLTAVRNAFYYHAWPEVWVEEDDGPRGAGGETRREGTAPGTTLRRDGTSTGPRRGLWLPVDPTLNQFPADTTHLRLARGGLDRQVAILPLIGRLQMTILDLELVPGASPVLVGPRSADLDTIAPPVPARGRTRGGCWFFGDCRGCP
jgi:transglutaminase-like putative cysteine protease